MLSALDGDPKIAVPQLAKLVDLSQSQLECVFKNELGIAIRDYRRELRLKRAKHLIATTTMPLKEIPEHCGIPDLSNLSRNFKKRYGVPPAKYRRQRGNLRARG